MQQVLYTGCLSINRKESDGSSIEAIHRLAKVLFGPLPGLPTVWRCYAFDNRFEFIYLNDGAINTFALPNQMIAFRQQPLRKTYPYIVISD